MQTVLRLKLGCLTPFHNSKWCDTVTLVAFNFALKCRIGRRKPANVCVAVSYRCCGQLPVFLVI